MIRFNYQVSGVAKNGDERSYYFVLKRAAYLTFNDMEMSLYTRVKIRILGVAEGTKLYREYNP